MVARSGPGPLMLRQLAARRRRWRRWGIAAGVIVVLAGLVYLVVFSPVLTARHVQVTGVKNLTTQEVVGVAQVPIGIPLARLDGAAIEQRVSKLAPVKTVRVSRAWPRTVNIEIRERTPALAVKEPNGYRLVDETGVGYYTVPKPPVGTVQSPTTDEARWVDLATVVVALGAQVRNDTASVEAKTADSIVILLKNNARVEWGGAEKSADKAIVLDSLRRAAPKAKVYNVSAPAHPTTR